MELDTFHDGDVIYAGPINENFQALKERELGSLGDVDVSGADVDKVLKYNGVKWYAGNDDGGTAGSCEWDTVTGGINYAGGNVGIGTTSPTQLLTLNNGAINTYAQFHNTNSGATESDGLLLGINTSLDSYFLNYEAGNLIFGTRGTEHVRIDNTGNVGIGTTNPQAALDMGSGGIRLGGVTRTTWPTKGAGVWTESGSDIYWGDGTGRVGIGTMDPTCLLHLYDSNGGADLKLESGIPNGDVGISFNGDRTWLLHNDGDGTVGTADYFHIMDWTAGAARMTFDTTGNVGIGTTSPSYRLQVGETSNYGYVDATGAWQSSSDGRKKENISEIDSGLDKVLAMRGVEYNTIGANPGTERQVGFIAQEMEQVIPEIVSTDQDGYKGVACAKLTPVLVKAIQEQQEMLDIQQQMIEELKKEIADLKNN